MELIERMESEEETLRRHAPKVWVNVDRKNFLLLLQDCKATIEQLQAKIDWLMLEYCPDEMTEEQMDNWGKHQVLAKHTGSK